MGTPEPLEQIPSRSRYLCSWSSLFLNFNKWKSPRSSPPAFNCCHFVRAWVDDWNHCMSHLNLLQAPKKKKSPITHVLLQQSHSSRAVATLKNQVFLLPFPHSLSQTRLSAGSTLISFILCWQSLYFFPCKYQLITTVGFSYSVVWGKEEKVPDT